MGCCNSKPIIPIGNGYNDIISSKQLSVAKRLCNLSDEDAERLYKEFVSLDLDSSGKISVQEFLFAFLDSDGSEELSFAEFVIALWSFLTTSEDHLSQLAFELYDVDGTGRISLSEIEKIVADMYGLNWRRNKMAARIVKDIKTKLKDMSLREACEGEEPKEEGYTPVTFHDFLHQHESLLIEPMFDIYTNLRERLVGKKFWNNLSNARYKMSHGEYIDFKKSMVLLNENDHHQRRNDDNVKNDPKDSSPVVIYKDEDDLVVEGEDDEFKQYRDYRDKKDKLKNKKYKKNAPESLDTAWS